MFSPKPRFSFLVLSLCVCNVAIHASNCDFAQGDVTQAISTAIAHLKDDQSAYNDAAQKLKALPRDQVIKALVKHLREDDDWKFEPTRSRAYSQLASLGGQNDETGLEQFVLCLKEARHRGSCARALGKVNDDAHIDGAIAGLGAGLVGAIESEDWTGCSQVVRALGRHGNRSKQYLPAIESMFLNDQLESRLRSQAFYAALRIEGLEYGFESYQRQDSISKEILLLSLAGYVAERIRSGEQLEPAEERYVSDVRVLVVKALLGNPLKDVRESAFEFLLPLYGKDFLVAKEDGTFQANPEFVAAIESMATNDPEERLRARAQSALDTMEQRVRKAIHRRERRQSRLPGRNGKDQ